MQSADEWTERQNFAGKRKNKFKAMSLTLYLITHDLPYRIQISSEICKLTKFSGQYMTTDGFKITRFNKTKNLTNFSSEIRSSFSS